jgi:hypothetical protein
MTDLRTAAAQQALEALEAYLSDELRPYEAAKTADALRAALAEPVQEPVQEPVAWLRVIDEAMVTYHLGVAEPTDDYETAKRKMNNLLCHAEDIGAYFATPPQRPPLTDEEIAVIEESCMGPVQYGGHENMTQERVFDVLAFARAIERKVRGETE